MRVWQEKWLKVIVGTVILVLIAKDWEFCITSHSQNGPYLPAFHFVQVHIKVKVVLMLNVQNSSSSSG